MSNKKILAIYFSQTGQLGEIVSNFVEPLTEAGHHVEIVRYSPKNEFVFPWTSERFFDAMPESVAGIPVALAPIRFNETKYDLILFAYQPWFLSPSIPANSLLKQSHFQELIKDTPVVTLIGARNMWINSQERVKELLVEADAKLVGNVTWVDRNQNHVSAVTILYWMLTGKKDKYLGVFPRPGVSDEDIRISHLKGAAVNESLEKNDFTDLQQRLVKLDAVYLNLDLAFIENTGSKIFKIWANAILKKKNRTFWLKIFKYYLLFALFIVAPFIVLLNKIIVRPFVRKKIAAKKKYYLGLN